MPENNQKTILIADDEPDISTILQLAFENQGYRVKVVANGKMALEEIKNEKPDLVITDIMMPLINGLKLCEMIKFDNAFADIPVILLTAVYTQDHHIDLGFKHGADAYFSKPFNTDRILEVSKKLLTRISS